MSTPVANLLRDYIAHEWARRQQEEAAAANSSSKGAHNKGAAVAVTPPKLQEVRVHTHTYIHGGRQALC